MRVRLDMSQVYDVLEALRCHHLCDTCEYDENLNVIKGTECNIQKLINKFERIYSGSSSEQGRKGGRTIQRSRLLGRSATKDEIAFLEGQLSHYTDKIHRLER